MSLPAYAQSPRLETTLGNAAPIAPVAPSVPYSPTAAAAAQGAGAEGGSITMNFLDLPLTLRPSFRIETRHDDNIYLAPTNRSSDQVLILTPSLTLDTRKGTNQYMLRLSTTLGQYQQHRADNYTSYDLGAQASLDLGTSLRANLSAAYQDGIDPRGSTNNAISSTPDHYRQTQGRGVLSYGAPGARGRIDFELGQLRRTYLNNRGVTAGSDRVVDDYGATFYWRLGPRTTALIQGKHSKIDYVDTASTLPSTEDALLAGATWEATAKTRLAFRAGTVRKQFEDSARAGGNIFSWVGELGWSPLTYSRVDLNLTRQPAETTGGVGNFIDQTKSGARWTHDWNSRFRTEVSGSYQTDAYQGIGRTDNIQIYGLRATYKMRRWLSLGGDITHSERASSNGNFDYRRNQLMLFLYAAL